MRAIQYAEDSNYILLEAQSLCKLAELHREKNNLEEAVSNTLKALELLKKTESKNTLAEVYFQLGLNNKFMRNIEESNRNFQEAIRLFSEMEAPRQMERVRRSMENQK